MHNAGDVISYLEMCREWGASFQRGMYFKLRGPASVLLMSRRRDAVYEDQVQDNGKILIYEGHDAPRLKGGPDPKRVDQPAASPSGMPTQNQLFYQAAQRFKRGEGAAEQFKSTRKFMRASGCITVLSSSLMRGVSRAGSEVSSSSN